MRARAATSISPRNAPSSPSHLRKHCSLTSEPLLSPTHPVAWYTCQHACAGVPQVPSELRRMGAALDLMHGFYLRSGQLVNGKFVSVLSFSNFPCICCRYRFW